MIPQANPKAAYELYAPALQAAAQRVLQSGMYIMGPECQRFEQTFAAYVGVGHGVGTASGTDGLELCLRACGVRPGDGVVTVSHTAVATVAAIQRLGAIPWLVDVEPDSLCMSPQALEKVLHQDQQQGRNIRAIVPVHLYGRMANMPSILAVAAEHGHLPVIEDCAQAHGATWQGRQAGAWGKAAAFSFYPTKNLAGFGDGGMAVTSDDQVAESLRLLRQYGWQERYISRVVGINSRLDEMQAAFLQVMLPELDRRNHQRQAIARRYGQGLAGLTFILPEDVPGHVYHQFVLQCDQVPALQAFLRQQDIATAIHYPLPVHRQPAFQGQLPGGEDLPVTESLVGRILSLPMYPELQESQVDYIIATLARWPNP